MHRPFCNKLLFIRGTSFGLSFGRLVVAIACLIFSPALLAVDPPVIKGTNAVLDKTDSVKDLRYGTVLYEFYQENYFEALKLLNVAKAQGGIKNHGDFPELMEGGIALSYGLDHKAQEIFNRLLESNTDQSVNSQVRFYLAKVLNERGLALEAARVLGTVSENSLPKEIRGEYLFHELNLYLETTIDQINELENVVQRQAKQRRSSGAPAGATESGKAQLSQEQKDLKALRETLWSKASNIIESIEKGSIWQLYGQYNLAITYQQLGQSLQGVAIMESLVKAIDNVTEQNDELRALRDRANMAAGYMNLYDERYYLAMNAFKLVHLDSLFSNKALLGYGWAALKAGNQQLSVNAWTELSKRSASDLTVQETFVAIPYAYEQMGIKGAALSGFEKAVGSYQHAIARIDDVIADVEQGQFIDAFFQGYELGRVGWFADTPAIPLTVPIQYLASIVTLGQFQEVLKDIQDLMSLRLNVEHWLDTVGTYRDILEARKIAHERFIGAGGRVSLYKEKQALAKKLRDEYELLRAELDRVKRNREVLALSDNEEMQSLITLKQAKEMLETFVEQPHFAKVGKSEKYQQRIDRLSRLIYWQANDAFEGRLWAVEKQMSIIKQALRDTQFSGLGVEKALDITPELKRYDRKISSLEKRLNNVLFEIDQHVEQHKSNMRALAVAQLRQQQNSLRRYMRQANLAIVRLYDESVSASEDYSEVKP